MGVFCVTRSSLIGRFAVTPRALLFVEIPFGGEREEKRGSFQIKVHTKTFNFSDQKTRPSVEVLLGYKLRVHRHRIAVVLLR